MAVRLQAHRPFGNFNEADVEPPSRSSNITIQNPADERAVLWRLLLATGDLDERSSILFPSRFATKHYLPEFRNFVAQAKIYDDAANEVRHASRSLLQYYAALQLAKAELLVHCPGDVYDKRVGHGLSYNPTAARSFETDYVTIQKGVFSSLYKVRTGLDAPIGARLEVQRVVRSLPDIGFEAGFAGMGPALAAHAQLFLCNDAETIWGLAVIATSETVAACPTTRKALGERFRLVEVPHQFRHQDQDALALETLWQEPLVTAGAVDTEDVERATAHFSADLSPFVGTPIYGQNHFTSSLYRSQFRPLPSDLARYVSIFYLSGISRYKPSRLDANRDSRAAWILSAVSDESEIHLLRSFLHGISKHLYKFTFGFSL